MKIGNWFITAAVVLLAAAAPARATPHGLLNLGSHLVDSCNLLSVFYDADAPAQADAVSYRLRNICDASKTEKIIQSSAPAAGTEGGRTSATSAAASPPPFPATARAIAISLPNSAIAFAAEERRPT